MRPTQFSQTRWRIRRRGSPVPLKSALRGGGVQAILYYYWRILRKSKLQFFPNVKRSVVMFLTRFYIVLFCVWSFLSTLWAPFLILTFPFTTFLSFSPTASGEPPMNMSCAVFFALRKCVAEARKDAGNMDEFTFGLFWFLSRPSHFYTRIQWKGSLSLMKLG